MKRKIISKIAISILEEEAHLSGIARPSIGYGCLSLLDKISVRAELNGHPIDNHTKILNALDRAPEVFHKRKIRAYDINGRSRLVRIFDPKWDLNNNHIEILSEKK